ncbi:general substrate transporter [Penicillium malachiteum]|nr:general substrate transporter [Penicillium malachiteum]
MVLVDKTLAATVPREVHLLNSIPGVSTSNISGILSMSPFEKAFGFNDESSTQVANIKGWMTSCILLGSCMGALIAAPISERLGRKLSLMAFSLLYIVSAILMAANYGGSGGLAQFFVGRVGSGIACGAASVTGTAFIAEISPKVIRGGLSALYNASTMMGISLAFWINYGSLLHISSNSNTQWQVPAGVQAFPGVILFIGLFCLPESPRWLASKNMVEKTISSVTNLRGLDANHPFVQEELTEIFGSSPTAQQLLEQTNSSLFTRLRSVPNLLKRFILVVLVQTFFQFSGGNIITYYNTTILDSLGLSDLKTSFLFSGIYGLVKVFAVLIYVFYFVDSWGRRPLLWFGSTIIIICLTYMTIYLAVLQDISGHKGAGWAAIVAIFLYAIGYALSWATVPWIINAEVFPMSVRAICMAATITWQYLVNFALTRAMPNMMESMDTYGPFAMFACVTAIAFVYSYFAFPETKGLNMAQINTLFEASWYKIGHASIKMVRENAAQSASIPMEVPKEDVNFQHCESIHGRV